MPTASFVPGSHRDRDGRVFTYEGRIFRALTARAFDDWTRFRDSPSGTRAMASGAVVETTQLPAGTIPSPPGSWHAVLGHRAIPFISYPYEWTFEMLRDAALLQLDLLLEGLRDGIVLKDGSPFNIQWIGTTPTFIDISSFTSLRPGAPWAGYRQFCCLCLNPLLLQAHTGVSFRPWLRGSLEGIDPADLTGLLSWRNRLRGGVFTHVYLHARLQRRFEGTTANLRQSLQEGGVDARVIAATAGNLRRTIAALPRRAPSSAWVDYASQHGYQAEGHARKRAFVERVLAERRRALVWDMGANTGEYARLAAAHSDYVVAFDADEAAVERLYRELRQAGIANILPLVVNAANPSPDQGWRGAERQSLPSRGRPDLVICLALVHHLVFGAAVPVADLIDHLADLTGELIIEYVDRDDPMVVRLLRNRDDVFSDYTREQFEAQLSRRFRIACREAVPGSPRVLYYARRAGVLPHLGKGSEVTA